MHREFSMSVRDAGMCVLIVAIASESRRRGKQPLQIIVCDAYSEGKLSAGKEETVLGKDVSEGL